MCAALLSCMAFADGVLLFKYNDSTMTASVKKLQVKDATEVVIPSQTEFSGKVYRVTEIEKLAFDERKNLVSVKIPNSVTRIEEDAFAGCSSLKSVRVPKCCGIGEDAFPPTCEIIRY